MIYTFFGILCIRPISSWHRVLVNLLKESLIVRNKEDNLFELKQYTDSTKCAVFRLLRLGLSQCLRVIKHSIAQPTPAFLCKIRPEECLSETEIREHAF